LYWITRLYCLVVIYSRFGYICDLRFICHYGLRFICFVPAVVVFPFLLLQLLYTRIWSLDCYLPLPVGFVGCWLTLPLVVLHVTFVVVAIYCGCCDLLWRCCAVICSCYVVVRCWFTLYVAHFVGLVVTFSHLRCSPLDNLVYCCIWPLPYRSPFTPSHMVAPLRHSCSLPCIVPTPLHLPHGCCVCHVAVVIWFGLYLRFVITYVRCCCTVTIYCSWRWFCIPVVGLLGCWLVHSLVIVVILDYHYRITQLLLHYGSTFVIIVIYLPLPCYLCYSFTFIAWHYTFIYCALTLLFVFQVIYSYRGYCCCWLLRTVVVFIYCLYITLLHLFAHTFVPWFLRCCCLLLFVPIYLCYTTPHTWIRFVHTFTVVPHIAVRFLVTGCHCCLFAVVTHVCYVAHTLRLVAFCRTVGYFTVWLLHVLRTFYVSVRWTFGLRYVVVIVAIYVADTFTHAFVVLARCPLYVYGCWLVWFIYYTLYLRCTFDAVDVICYVVDYVVVGTLYVPTLPIPIGYYVYTTLPLQLVTFLVTFTCYTHICTVTLHLVCTFGWFNLPHLRYTVRIYCCYIYTVCCCIYCWLLYITRLCIYHLRLLRLFTVTSLLHLFGCCCYIYVYVTLRLRCICWVTLPLPLHFTFAFTLVVPARSTFALYNTHGWLQVYLRLYISWFIYTLRWLVDYPVTQLLIPIAFYLRLFTLPVTYTFTWLPVVIWLDYTFIGYLHGYYGLWLFTLLLFTLPLLPFGLLPTVIPLHTFTIHLFTLYIYIHLFYLVTLLVVVVYLPHCILVVHVIWLFVVVTLVPFVTLHIYLHIAHVPGWLHLRCYLFPIVVTLCYHLHLRYRLHLHSYCDIIVARLFYYVDITLFYIVFTVVTLVGYCPLQVICYCYVWLLWPLRFIALRIPLYTFTDIPFWFLWLVYIHTVICYLLFTVDIWLFLVVAHLLLVILTFT